MASPEAKVDIATFVEETLQRRQENGDLMVQDQSIFDDIKRALINRADGMFLWVTFLLDEICAQTCDDDIRDAVERLPKTLTETLSKALHRIIKQGKSTIANKAFQWIAIAKRPLTLDELREAISTKVGQPSSNPGQMVNGIDRLPTWCENLVRVDEESRTAEFAHKAVHKFIVEGSSGPDYAEFHFKPEDADHHAERLLSAGANVNGDPSYYGRTALQAASGGGYISVVERLLSAGANVNAAPVRHGQTALQAASEAGHVEVVERLRAAGAHE
ncbi:Ankyrin repeat domain-containing protein 29 [Colletotrichum fructicola]|nr:Ankyrin repeat domain-containing protein 29 [Colletotrichum fructicola]